MKNFEFTSLKEIDLLIKKGSLLSYKDQRNFVLLITKKICYPSKEIAIEIYPPIRFKQGTVYSVLFINSASKHNFSLIQS